MSQVRAEAEASSDLSSQRQNEDEEALETRECDDHEDETSEQEDENKEDSGSEDKSDEGEENDDDDQEDEQHEEENDPEDEEDDVGDDSDEEKNSENDSNIDTGNVPSYSQKLKNALIGDLDGEFPENVKVVRIFTSSTFTGKYVNTQGTDSMNTNAGICILVRHSIEICRTSSVKKIKIGITVLLPIEQSECLYVSLNVFLVHSLTSFLTECRFPEISIHT